MQWKIKSLQTEFIAVRETKNDNVMVQLVFGFVVNTQEANCLKLGWLHDIYGAVERKQQFASEGLLTMSS